MVAPRNGEPCVCVLKNWDPIYSAGVHTGHGSAYSDLVTSRPEVGRVIVNHSFHSRPFIRAFEWLGAAFGMRMRCTRLNVSHDQNT
jgi:hypothetical protein